MRITVTDRDIHKARAGPRNGTTCPIARAVTRQMGDARGAPAVSVNPTTIDINHTRLSLPPAAQAFVAAFDADEAVTPFAFDLDATSL